MIGHIKEGISRLLAVGSLLVLCATAVLAQDLPGIDMRQWTDIAEKAEAAVDASDTQAEELDTLRSSLVGYREQFNTARGANATRIASLRDQLALLGAAPPDGDGLPEAAEVSDKRKELEAQLATLTTPVQVAESAYARADGLVGEIDTILRAKQAEKLAETVATTLNPAHWPVAIEALRSALSKLWLDVAADQSVSRHTKFIENLPIILFAGIAALVLVFRGRRWSKMIVGRFSRSEVRSLGVWRFVFSLLRIVFPFVGLVLFSTAAVLTDYLGERGNEIAMLVPLLGGLMLGYRWVAEQVFSRDDDEALLLLSQKDRADARFLVSGMTLVLSINFLLLHILELDEASELARAVIAFPFTILMSLGLYRLGRLLRHFGATDPVEEEEEITRSSSLARLVRGLGGLSMLVAVVAPLLHAAGYFNASASMLPPTFLTMVILGLVLALQRFSAEVYGAFTGQGKEARESLVPIFFGVLLLLLALPVLALGWGARVADLTEIWTAFKRGFSIGNSQISPTDFLTFALIFILGYVATRLVQGALKTNVLPKTKIDKGGQNAIVSGLGYVGIFLAALAAITGAGIDLSSLAIVAGALSVGIGFGLQNIVSNFVSGIILLIERPISEGDWIEVSGGQMGFVRDISVRSTRIETFDKTDVIVPNADLVSGTVINYTRGNTLGRVIIPVGVAYGTDTKNVEEILYEIANAQPMALANPGVQVLFLNFGASSMDFEIRIFLRDVTWLNIVKNDVNHAIAKRFAEEGIEIPFAQQDVWLRNPEALVAAAAKPARKKPVPKPKGPTKTITTDDGDQT